MLRASRATLVEEHVQNCPACAMKLSQATGLEDALDQLRVSTMHVRAPAAVERNLRDAFRREAARRRCSVKSAFPWRFVWLSAAALVLLAAGVVFYSSSRQNSLMTVESNRSGNQVEIRPRTPGAAAEALRGDRETAAVNAATISKRRIAKTEETIPERVALRAPMPVSDELSWNGGGSVVRVTLPLSSLTAMGLPLHADLSDPRVTADVWMDPFGAVVGIRLVAPKTNAD
jgi:hypothetical protein